MRRLIDAEILTDYFVEHDLAFQYAIQHQDRKELERLIAEIPTAYDPDKVVEQLEDYGNEEVNYYKNTPYEKCIEECVNKAIEIVKAGEADAEHGLHSLVRAECGL